MGLPVEHLPPPRDAGWELAALVAERDRAAAALDRLEAAVARKRAVDYLEQSRRDSLTGALQRQAGRDALSNEVDRARRGNSPLVVAFLDIVGLKQVNDTHGHATGDLVLSAVGSALVAGLRSYDLVVRYGGDEFVCCLPGATLDEGTRRLAGVRAALAHAAMPIGLRCGAALLQEGESLDDVVARADRAMYESGRRGALGRRRERTSHVQAAPDG